MDKKSKKTFVPFAFNKKKLNQPTWKEWNLDNYIHLSKQINPTIPL